MNFNSANTDTQIPVILPAGYTRYLVSTIRISGASASLTTATFGVFTATGGGGTTILTTTSCTVSTASDGTANNLQSVASGVSTVSFTLSGFPNLYFRVVAAEGSAATANVEIQIVPLS